MEGHVTTLQTCLQNKTAWFKAVVEATQKTKLGYNAFVAYKLYPANEGRRSKRIWGLCNCPAGTDGMCKHSIALQYKIWSCAQLGTEVLDGDFDTPTPTGKLQLWHAMKPTNDEPLLFSEINFVRHDESRAGRFVQPLGAEIARHQLLPSGRATLPSSRVMDLASSLRRVGFDPPVLKNLEANEYKTKASRILSNEQSQEVLVDKLFEIMEKASYSKSIVPNNEYELTFLRDFILVDWPKSREIERNTRFQSQSKHWYKARLHRITATQVHSLASENARTDAWKRFAGKRKFFTSSSVQHDIRFEEEAFHKFLNVANDRDSLKIEAHSSIGLLVHPNFSFTGASPDRLISIDGELFLVEIKCPYNPFIRKKSLKLKFKDKDFYINLDKNGKPFLKENHPYYSQIQAQLLISNIEKAFLVLFVPPIDIEYFVIYRNHSFINRKMDVLHKVYQENLLPQFVQEVYRIQQ
ncbi:uncharacterized protein LOC132205261 [Neocloeon triangulifer]|uniref:uncharacterized protein LOC132205261 n=1 Tax=Neocloeon triangulifer TaxID=2078957 RepID=UPI00286EF83C|nr:uncharacterized protein LOC132205261 [Neocloeon triangulifer]